MRVLRQEVLPEATTQRALEGKTLANVGNRNRIERLFRWVHPSLYEGVSVRPMDGPSVRNLFFLMLEMENFLNENHWADQL